MPEYSWSPVGVETQPCKCIKLFSRLLRVNFIYTGFVALFLLIEVVTSFCQPPVGTSCVHTKPPNHWHWSSIIWIDTSQSALMVVLVLVMWLALQKRSREVQDEVSDLQRSFKSQSQVRFQTQIKTIAVFYLFSSFADWFYYSVGKSDLQNGNIECLNTSFLIPRNNKGSIIFVVYTLFTYCYSLVVLYVFYLIP